MDSVTSASRKSRRFSSPLLRRYLFPPGVRCQKRAVSVAAAAVWEATPGGFARAADRMSAVVLADLARRPDCSSKPIRAAASPSCSSMPRLRRRATDRLASSVPPESGRRLAAIPAADSRPGRERRFGYRPGARRRICSADLALLAARAATPESGFEGRQFSPDLLLGERGSACLAFLTSARFGLSSRP